MELFVDSGDICKIKKAFEEFPVTGVTTNPTIIARDIKDDNVALLLETIKEYSGNRKIIVQVASFEKEAMIRDAKRIYEYLNLPKERLSVKIPMGTEGLKAMNILAENDFSITATAVYSVNQALLAGLAGAEYAAPYISHIDNLGLDGPSEAAKMAETLVKNNLKTKVLAASFRTAAQVSRCFEMGVPAATVTYEMLSQMAFHPGTESECEAFKKNWSARFGEKEMSDLL